MNKRQLKFYWVLLHEWLEREQVDTPPDTVKELKIETKRMSDHLQSAFEGEAVIPTIKKQAILLESNGHPNGSGIAFYSCYCYAIGE